jgi:hypothetical protein
VLESSQHLAVRLLTAAVVQHLKRLVRGPDNYYSIAISLIKCILWRYDSESRALSLSKLFTTAEACHRSQAPRVAVGLLESLCNNK